MVLPSFLAGGGERKIQKEMRGIFDSNILNHTPGDRFIYDVVKEYFQKNTPISQRVEGRLNIVDQKPSSTTTPPTTTTTTTSSVSPIVTSPILLVLVTKLLLTIWN